MTFWLLFGQSQDWPKSCLNITCFYSKLLPDHVEICQKYSPKHQFFNSLLDVWKCGQTQSFMFDINTLNTHMIFWSFALLSFVLAFKFPDVKNSVWAWIKDSSAVCSILWGAQTGVNVVSGWFSFTDQADLVRFSVSEFRAAPGINLRWFRTDMKSHSSNLLKALRNKLTSHL